MPNPELIPFYYVVFFICHLPFVQKREISKRSAQCQILKCAQVQAWRRMSWWCVTVCSSCFLFLYCSSGLGVWVSALQDTRIMSQSNMWSSYRGTCICALGKAGNQDGVCGSFGWFRVWKMLTTTYARQMWWGGEFQYNDLIYALCVVRWKVLKIAFTAFCGVPSKAAFNTSAIEARPRAVCWLV